MAAQRACDDTGWDKNADTNGIHLFWLPDMHRLDPTAISVAFSLRAEDAKVFEANSWILPIDEGYLTHNEAAGWTLLGYDVADSGLTYSGFYGFTWTPDELAKAFAGMDVVFNRFGLLGSEELAVAVAQRLLEHMTPSDHHTPFYPVRVWVQTRAQD